MASTSVAPRTRHGSTTKGRSRHGCRRALRPTSRRLTIIAFLVFTIWGLQVPNWSDCAVRRFSEAFVFGCIVSADVQRSTFSTVAGAVLSFQDAVSCVISINVKSLFMKSSLLFVRAAATCASGGVQHPPTCQGIDRISTSMASSPFSMPTSAAPPMAPTADLCDLSPSLYRTPHIQAIIVIVVIVVIIVIIATAITTTTII